MVRPRSIARLARRYSLPEGGKQQASKSGSTPPMLAKRTTGRGGVGLPEAKIQQQEILAVLREYGAV
jgi:hypothetical protein